MQDLYKAYACLKTKDKLISCVLLFLLVSEIAFIFSNSVINATESTGKSDVFVTFFIEKIMGIQMIDTTEEFVGNVTHFIRKLAHFCEFSLMSATLSFMISVYITWYKKILILSTAFSFVIGCIDEFLQLFSEGRAPMFSDVMLDTTGGLCGALFVIIVLVLPKLIKTKKQL